MDMSQDLFECVEQLPEDVQSVIAKYASEDPSTDACRKMHKELGTLGYTFDFDLGGNAFDLQKIDD